VVRRAAAVPANVPIGTGPAPFEGSVPVHGRLFMGRRFTRAGESTGYCLLRVRKLALRTGEPGLSGMILGDTGISGLPGQHASPFGTLFLFLVRTGRGP
jgi:hypothetical protein